MWSSVINFNKFVNYLWWSTTFKNNVRKLLKIKSYIWRSTCNNLISFQLLVQYQQAHFLCISSLCLQSLPEQSLKILTPLKHEKRLKHQSTNKWCLFQCKTVYGKDMWHALFSILATTQNANYSVSELLLSVADRQMIKS